MAFLKNIAHFQPFHPCEIEEQYSFKTFSVETKTLSISTYLYYYNYFENMPIASAKNSVELS